MRKVHNQQHLKAAPDPEEMDESNQLSSLFNIFIGMEEIIEEMKFHNQLSSLFNAFISIIEVTDLISG